MNKSTYLIPLRKLVRAMDAVKNTPFGMYNKTLHLILLNVRFEKIAFVRRLNTHPYKLTQRLIEDTLASFHAFEEIGFIESKNKEVAYEEKASHQETKHHNLFNMIWNQYGKSDYRKYIDRYKYRIRKNRLIPLIKGKRILDMGCGNGNFCFALAELGAAQAVGIDFGEQSIAFANKLRTKLSAGKKCRFVVSSIYHTPFPKHHFDFVIQNGVFHHLDNERKAVREVKRVIKPGGISGITTMAVGGSFKICGSPRSICCAMFPKAL